MIIKNHNTLGMKKKIIIGIAIFSLAVLSTIGFSVTFSNQSNNNLNLSLANIDAMASDSEGSITDPNIALHCYLTSRIDNSGKLIANCCVRRNYEDVCNYKLQWGDCRGNW